MSNDDLTMRLRFRAVDDSVLEDAGITEADIAAHLRELGFSVIADAIEGDDE